MIQNTIEGIKPFVNPSTQLQYLNPHSHHALHSSRAPHSAPI